MNQLGLWSSVSLFVVGVLYAITVSVGVYTTGFTKPIVDPILAVMEILTLVSSPLLVILVGAIHSTTPSELKGYSSAAFAFMILTAGLTSSVHFIGLTALRQTGIEGIIWPSVLYAAELLAWDIFLGLSLIFMAPLFQGAGLKRKIRSMLILTGTFCIIGSVGPFSGDMRFQFISVLGYGVLLPFVWFMMARNFQCACSDISENFS